MRKSTTITTRTVITTTTAATTITQPTLTKTLCLTLLASAALVTLVACDKEQPPAPAAAAPTSAPSVVPAPAPSAEKPQPKPEGRPKKLDLALTPERRTAIEAKYPAEKGFLVAKEVEAQLQANKKLKDEKGALAAFDKLAKGKSLLFAGNATNLAAQGFDMGVVYSPQLPGDATGISRQWFPVTLSDIDGYKPDSFKVGDLVVVLVKYNGVGKAGPGHELVAAGLWQ